MSDITVQRSGVSRAQALYVIAIPDRQVATLRQQDAIVRKSRFAGSASGDREDHIKQIKRLLLDKLC